MCQRLHLTDRHDLCLRRIAEARRRAALPGDGKRRRFVSRTHRHRQAEPLAIDFAGAKEFIFVTLAFWELERGDLRLCGRDADLLAIEVVALFDLPVERQVVLILLKIEGKGAICGNKLPGAGRVKQPGKGGRTAKQQD